MLLCVDKVIHHIYYLWSCDPNVSEDAEFLYVGRSTNPKARQRKFEKRTGIKTWIFFQTMPSFEFAQKAERRIIQEDRPRFNIKIMSSRGTLGIQGLDLWVRRSKRPEDQYWSGRHHTEISKAAIRDATVRQFLDPVKRERHRIACIEATLRRKENSL